MANKTTFEFRILEADAARHLGPGIGKVLGDPLSGYVRKVEVRPGDPLFEQIGKVHLELKAQRGSGLFTAWIPHRRYSKAELAAAQVLRLSIPTVFEPAGEECGTKYDDSSACPACGYGRRQTSELTLDLRRIQRGRDIDTQTIPRQDMARTIADEIVVSRRFAMLLRDSGVSGVDLRPVFQQGRSEPSPHWNQLAASGPHVAAVPPTVFGIDPFDLDETGRYRCPLGHVTGLNLLSELTVDGRSWPGTDLAATTQAVGIRQGLLVPSPLLVISPALWRLVDEHRITGAAVEVAHLGDPGV